MKKVIFSRYVLALMVFSLLISCGKENDPNPGSKKKSTLSARLNGQLWLAEGFDVDTVENTTTQDAHLYIQAEKVETNIELVLYIYGVTKPGTYQFNQKGNNRRWDSRLTMTNPQNASLSFFGNGPTTMNFTIVDKDHYAGTFSGTFTDLLNPQKTVEITDGKFDVRLGIQ